MRKKQPSPKAMKTTPLPKNEYRLDPPSFDYIVNVVSCSRANEAIRATIINAVPVEQDTWWSGFVIAPCCHIEDSN